MNRKWRLLLLAVCCITSYAVAQESPIKLFPKGAPGEKVKLTEKGDSKGGKVGGETVLRITDISDPEITIYPAPKDLASGAAMVVCPGGGYNILAYDLEGTEICEWLNKLGITGVLLKYRVPRREGLAKHEAPLQDVQRTISYVRANAKKYNINTAQIGVMGFSAGGHLSVMASTHYNERTYPAIDDVDKVSCRPDFCLLVYPAYLDKEGGKFELAPEIKVTKDVPPTMFVQAEDDKWFINCSLFYYYALKEAGVPVWMHLYSQGGHGYGLRDTGKDVNEWPERAEDWFREIGVIK